MDFFVERQNNVENEKKLRKSVFVSEIIYIYITTEIK